MYQFPHPLYVGDRHGINKQKKARQIYTGIVALEITQTGNCLVISYYVEVVKSVESKDFHFRTFSVCQPEPV